MEEIALREMAEKLREGQIVLASLPTGYALICDARNDEPVKRLRKLKSRPKEKGFTVMVESDARLNKYVKEVPAIAWDILDSAENPLILVLPEGRGICREALARDGSIAVRMVPEGYERKFVQSANCPVACTALLNDKGELASSPADATREVLSEVEYLISLPASDPESIPTQIPIVSLGMGGEVKVIREAQA